MGFTRAELEGFRGRSVPDLIPEEPKLVFVGINPGLWTAATGVHFAHPGNRFYPALLVHSVALPLARGGVLSAAVLSFAHTVGEFGVVLMIGGNIPGHTRVVATQIYGHVEALEYAQAHGLAGAMVLFSFAVLLALNLLNRRSARVLG